MTEEKNPVLQLGGGGARDSGEVWDVISRLVRDRSSRAIN